MRIKIESQEKNLNLALPSGLMSRIAFSGIGLRYLKKHGGDDSFSNLTKRDMKNIRKTLRRMRKIHKNWNIVEMDSADGDHVIIRL